MKYGAVHGLLVATFAMLAAAPLARAALPTSPSVQTLAPLPAEITPDPQGFPESPLFGSSLALAGTTALSGMPGAFNNAGRVAIFTLRNGSWVRTGTLQASDAASNAGFGSDVAFAAGRALVASRTAVYVFTVSGSTWLQTQKLKFDGPVQIGDLDWTGSIAVVGVGVNNGGTRTNGAYAFALTSSGQLQRMAKFSASDTAPADMFGNKVAIAGTIVAITAPGYNSDQGAAYFFGCTTSGCTERQKLLANDGKPGDHFGSSVGVRTHVLVVGANGAAPARPEDDGALGAGYLYLRTNGLWTETQKLGASAAEAVPYVSLGDSVAVTEQRVLLGGAGSPPFASGVVFVYEFSGGLLVPKKALKGRFGFGPSVTAIGNTAIVGTPQNSSTMPVGQANVFNLAR